MESKKNDRIILSVLCPDKSVKKMYVDKDTTGGEVLDAVAHRFNIFEKQCFTLKYKDAEGVLTELEKDATLAEQGLDGNKLELSLCAQLSMLPESVLHGLSEYDETTLHLLVFSLHNMVLTGQIPVTVDSGVYLTALFYYNDIGAYSETRYKADFFSKTAPKDFLPPSIVSMIKKPFPIAYWVNRVFTCLKSLGSELSVVEVRERYVFEVSKSPFFGVELFSLSKLQKEEDAPVEKRKKAQKIKKEKMKEIANKKKEPVAPAPVEKEEKEGEEEKVEDEEKKEEEEEKKEEEPNEEDFPAPTPVVEDDLIEGEDMDLLVCLDGVFVMKKGTLIPEVTWSHEEIAEVVLGSGRVTLKIREKKEVEVEVEEEEEEEVKEEPKEEVAEEEKKEEEEAKEEKKEEEVVAEPTPAPKKAETVVQDDLIEGEDMDLLVCLDGVFVMKKGTLIPEVTWSHEEIAEVVLGSGRVTLKIREKKEVEVEVEEEEEEEVKEEPKEEVAEEEKKEEEEAKEEKKEEEVVAEPTPAPKKAETVVQDVITPYHFTAIPSVLSTFHSLFNRLHEACEKKSEYITPDHREFANMKPLTVFTNVRRTFLDLMNEKKMKFPIYNDVLAYIDNLVDTRQKAIKEFVISSSTMTAPVLEAFQHAARVHIFKEEGSESVCDLTTFVLTHNKAEKAGDVAIGLLDFFLSNSSDATACTKIDIRGFNLGSNMSGLISSLQEVPMLIELSLPRCELGDSVRDLLEFLQDSCEKLQVLDIAGNKITDKCVQGVGVTPAPVEEGKEPEDVTLFKFFRQPHPTGLAGTLRKVSLGFNMFSSMNAVGFVKACVEGGSCVCVDMSGITFSPVSTSALVDVYVEKEEPKVEEPKVEETTETTEE
ncbi:hypothetical protein ADUPG1_014267, partial [Aduncisulcus paluster]